MQTQDPIVETMKVLCGWNLMSRGDTIYKFLGQRLQAFRMHGLD
jgi:hypothetical protein